MLSCFVYRIKNNSKTTLYTHNNTRFLNGYASRMKSIFVLLLMLDLLYRIERGKHVACFIIIYLRYNFQIFAFSRC